MAAYLIFGCACISAGFAAGGLLALIYSSAAMSRSQERMQRKVREAWDQAWRHQQECQDAHGASHRPRDRRETW